MGDGGAKKWRGRGPTSPSPSAFPGIDESTRRTGFADFALEVFYIDFIEAGCSRKAPFVIRTKDQWEMFQKSSCTSLSVRVIQREVTFQKGSINIDDDCLTVTIDGSKRTNY